MGLRLRPTSTLSSHPRWKAFPPVRLVYGITGVLSGRGVAQPGRGALHAPRRYAPTAAPVYARTSCALSLYSWNFAIFPLRTVNTITQVLEYDSPLGFMRAE
jgi:hypothetical protein